MSVGLKVVMAAALFMVIAGVLFFMVEGKSGRFSEITGGQVDNAECTKLKADYRLACKCQEQSSNPEEGEASDVKEKARENECNWASGSFTCENNVC